MTPVQVVATRVRELRQRRGLSLQQLADLCAEAGFPDLGRQVLTKLENGRRESVSIAEVLALAYVLDAPPVSLFVPLDGRTQLQLTPDIQLSGFTALGWVTGDSEPGDPERRQRWREVSSPVKLHADLRTRFNAAVRQEVNSDQQWFRSELQGLAQILNAMVETGIAPPTIPGDWLHSMRSEGWLKYPDELRSSDGDGDGAD